MTAGPSKCDDPILIRKLTVRNLRRSDAAWAADALAVRDELEWVREPRPAV
jgi:hypothetical protein